MAGEITFNSPLPIATRAYVDGLNFSGITLNPLSPDAT